MKNGINTNDILVSTIIPSYNQHTFVKEALFSVLNQTHTNQEVIIVNDYPCDKVREELNEIKKIDSRIHILHNTANMGIAATRNKGIGLGRGKYKAMLDHDDIRSDPDKIRKQVEVMEENKNIGLVGTQYTIIDENGKGDKQVDLPLSDSEIRRVINIQMPSLQSSMMFSSTLLDQIGGYNPKYSPCDDHEILYRAAKNALLVNLPDYSTQYRMYAGNTSKHLAQTMAKKGIDYLIEYGNAHPYFLKALLKKGVIYAYLRVKPYLSEDMIQVLRKIRAKHIYHTYRGINQ